MGHVIKLGSEVKCKTTGWGGTVIARAEWLYTVPSILIQPPMKDGVLPGSVWVHEPQMELVRGPKLEAVKNEDAG